MTLRMTLTAWLPRVRGRLIRIVPLSVLIGCSAVTDVFTPPIPPQSPGASVAGLPGAACPQIFLRSVQCMAWAPDGKTLYVIASRSAVQTYHDTIVVLLSVDPSTASARTLAAIPIPGSMVVTPDGSALLYAAAQDSLWTRFNVYRFPVSGVDTPSVVVRAGNSNILVSPDGTTLLYHTLGSTTSSDTIAALNLVSGLVTAKTVGEQLQATSFSSDGSQVALVSDTVQSFPHYIVYVGRAAIWDMTAGNVTPVQLPSGVTSFIDVEWTRGAFRAFASGPTGYFEIAVATGLITPFGNPAGLPNGAVAWVPSRPLMLTGFTDGKGYGESGGTVQFYLRAVQPGGVQDAVLGSINSGSGTTIHPFLPSPDGKWLAYWPQASSIYLLAIP